MTNAIMKYKLLLAFIIMLFIPMIVNNDYAQYIVNIILIYILVAIGFNIVIGYVGRFSFSNATFLGIGAYVVGLLMVKLNLSFWISLPIASIVTTFVGVLIGYPALRLHRYYLAIVTIAFMSLMQFIYIHGGELTGGPSGFDIPYPELFGFKFQNDKSIFYIILVTFFILFYIITNILKSKIGRSFIAVKNSGSAAEGLSINVRNTVLFAFALSGFIVGTAGGLLCIAIRRITPDSFGMMEVTKHFVMVVLGGLGSILGSVIGAIIISVLPEFLRGIQTYQEFIYGVTLIVFVLFAPEGINGYIIKYLPGVSRERLYKRK
jgi:branched-chain amino acid transport system permease protein